MGKNLNEELFGIGKKIVFDKEEKYLAIVSEREIAIITLDSDVPIQYKTINEQYSSIEDLIITSTL
jgi:hypothetical protein